MSCSVAPASVSVMLVPSYLTAHLVALVSCAHLQSLPSTFICPLKDELISLQGAAHLRLIASALAEVARHALITGDKLSNSSSSFDRTVRGTLRRCFHA